MSLGFLCCGHLCVELDHTVWILISMTVRPKIWTLTVNSNVSMATPPYKAMDDVYWFFQSKSHVGSSYSVYTQST